MHVKPDQASPDGPAAAELDELIGSDCPLCGERVNCGYDYLPIVGGGRALQLQNTHFYLITVHQAS